MAAKHSAVSSVMTGPPICDKYVINERIGNAEWKAGFRGGEGREEGDGGQMRSRGWKGNGGRGRGTGTRDGTGRNGKRETNRTCSAALRHFSVATCCVVP